MSGFNGGAVAPIQVANNLTTTGAGYALDARQGKTLNDKITKTISITNYTYNSENALEAAIAEFGNNEQGTVFATTSGSWRVQYIVCKRDSNNASVIANVAETKRTIKAFKTSGVWTIDELALNSNISNIVGDNKILTSTYTSTVKIPAITTLGFLVHDYGGTVSAYALYGGRCDLIAGTGGITTDGNTNGQTLTFPNSGINRVMLIYR